MKMGISMDQEPQDRRCSQDPYIYYCGDDYSERVRLAQQLDSSPEEECDFRCPCIGQHFREQPRFLAGAERHANDAEELPLNSHLLGGEEIASNALEIIRIVDELLSQATCLKQRLVAMLANFQTKMCKCGERHRPYEATEAANGKFACECSFHLDSEGNREGWSPPGMPTDFGNANTNEELLPASKKQSADKPATRIVRNDNEQKTAAPITNTISVAIIQSTAELDQRAPSTAQKPANSKTRLGAGQATGFSSSITLHRKGHEVIQLRDVSRQLLNIQQDIQMLRDQIAKMLCQTACHMSTVDTSDNENLLEEIMSSNLIGRADEIKQTLTEIKSDCYQKLSPSSDILPQLGEKKVHEKIERVVKRNHPDFSRTINQVKLTTGEKILDPNMQHTTFEQICETNIDTQRRDGSASKNMAFKVVKKTDEKILNPYSEDERREMLKQSKKVITTEDKAINEEDTINEQQINSPDKRTIETRRYMTKTVKVAGREPLKEVLLNVQINRTIDNKTGEVVETMQELNPDAGPSAVYHKQMEQGTLFMQPTEIKKSSFHTINERSYLTQDRSKAGSAICNTLQSNRCSDQGALSSKVASYFEVLTDVFETDGQNVRQSTPGKGNDITSAAERSVHDDARSHYESLRSTRADVDSEAMSRHDHELNSVEHFGQESSPKYDQKSRFSMESRQSKQTYPTNILSENCVRFTQDQELPSTENRCTATIQPGEGNELRSDHGEASTLRNDRSYGNQSHTGNRPENIYQPSKHTVQQQKPQPHDDVKSQPRRKAGSSIPSNRSYQEISHFQNQTYNARSNAVDQQSNVSRGTRAASHKTEFTRQDYDGQSRYDEVISLKPGSEKLDQIEDNVTQYSANRSGLDGAKSQYSHRYAQDRNDNEGQKNRFEPAAEWQSNTTRYRSENRSNKLRQTQAHSQEEHPDEKSRASDRLEHMIIDPGTDQSAHVSVGGIIYQMKASKADHVAQERTITGPYFYKVQSELKLLTDSKLDRICAIRANQRILGGANSIPHEPPVFDSNDQRKSGVGAKKESNRRQYEPSLLLKAQVVQVKPNLKPQVRAFHSTESSHTLISQAAHKMQSAKSHITIDPKFYYSETAAEPLTLNDRVASDSNFDVAKSELPSQNPSSERNSELLIKQDLRLPRSELAQQERETSQLMPSNLTYSTEHSSKSRIPAGKSNSPMRSNDQRPHESYPANQASMSLAGASLDCSPLIKSIRIDCIPRVVDELSGRRCPKDFFLSVVPNNWDMKTFRINIIDKQNGDVLGCFLIDEEKLQRARDQGMFDNFLTLYVLNSTVSAANLENRTNPKAANKHMCPEQCACHGKYWSTSQS